MHNSLMHRCHNHVEFFHDIKWFPFHPASGIQSNGHERVGRRVYVLYIRISTRVRVCQLRGEKKTPT